MDIHTVYIILLGILLFVVGDYIARLTAFICLVYGAYRICRDTIVNNKQEPKAKMKKDCK